jgi:hypothetical protein
VYLFQNLVLGDFETVILKYKEEDFAVQFIDVKPICMWLESWATVLRQKGGRD